MCYVIKTDVSSVKIFKKLAKSRDLESKSPSFPSESPNYWIWHNWRDLSSDSFSKNLIIEPSLHDNWQWIPCFWLILIDISNIFHLLLRSYVIFSVNIEFLRRRLLFDKKYNRLHFIHPIVALSARFLSVWFIESTMTKHTNSVCIGFMCVWARATGLPSRTLKSYDRSRAGMTSY